MAANILVMTSYPPAWRELADVTTKEMDAYCKLHGYDFDAWESELVDNGIPIAGFVKMDMFLYHMRIHKQYEAIVWLDADLLITNPEIRLEEFIGRAPGAQIILPYDYNGHNATVIIARTTELVYKYFWACNNTGRKKFLKDDWKEMEAMRYFAQTPPYNRMINYLSIKTLCPIAFEQYLPYVEPRVSQDFGWEEGDFSLHLSALHINKRIELAHLYANRHRVEA